MIQFGGIPPQTMEQLGKAYKECQEHVECEGCSLVNGNPLITGEGQMQSRIICENGLNKGVVKNEN